MHSSMINLNVVVFLYTLPSMMLQTCPEKFVDLRMKTDSLQSNWNL